MYRNEMEEINYLYLYLYLYMSVPLVPGRSAETSEELRSESWQDDRLLRLKYDQLIGLLKLYLQCVSEIWLMNCSKGQEPWINLLIRLPSRGTAIVSYTDKKEK